MNKDQYKQEINFDTECRTVDILEKCISVIKEVVKNKKIKPEEKLNIINEKIDFYEKKVKFVENKNQRKMNRYFAKKC